jgi:phosphohistidine phosphatase
MRRLILFRHSDAVFPFEHKDHARPLSPAGRAAAESAGALLARLDLPVDLVIASDARRTQETWSIAGAQFETRPELRVEPGLYDAARSDLIDMARSQPERVKGLILLGHNPSIAEFAMHFAGSGEHDALRRMSRGFPTSGIAIFEIDDIEWRKLRWGDGRLSHFITA